MSEQQVDISLGSLLMAILERYKKIEVSPAVLLQKVDPDYQLKIEFNENTEMFEISLEVNNES